MLFLSRYICTICGHAYDPDTGELPRKIRPGTAFPDLPSSWSCPICDAVKASLRAE